MEQAGLLGLVLVPVAHKLLGILAFLPGEDTANDQPSNSEYAEYWTNPDVAREGVAP